MDSLRREPFRLLFPLGVVIAWLAVLPWVLFGVGVTRVWLGTFHGLAMTQGFLLAMAVGFLGTMIPRRTGASPMASGELVFFTIGLAAIPLLLFWSPLLAPEVVYLAILVALARFALVRLRSASATRQPPPSFVWLPLGVIAAAIGAALLIASALGAPDWTTALGRSLVEEALLLSMVLALAPVLAPMIRTGAGVPDPAPFVIARQRRWHLVAAALFFLGFVLQYAVSLRAGLLLRGVVVATVVVATTGVFSSPTIGGLHRQLFRVALVLVPLGPLAAGARPAYRVPLLHLTFIGGFSLLVFAVSLHVVYMHTGREALAKRWSAPALVIGGLTISAALVRASAEIVSWHYVEVLTSAALLWLLAAAVWGTAVLFMVLRRAPKAAAP